MAVRRYAGVQTRRPCLFLGLERAGRPEVGQELVAEAHDEEPDVPRHLRSRDEQAPGDEEEGCVEEVVDVPEPGDRQTAVRAAPGADHLSWSLTGLPGSEQQLLSTQSLWLTGCPLGFCIFPQHALNNHISILFL